MITMNKTTRSMLNKYIPKGCILSRIPPRFFTLVSVTDNPKKDLLFTGLLIPFSPNDKTPFFIKKLEIPSTKVTIFQIMVPCKSKKDYKIAYQVKGTYKDLRDKMAIVFSRKQFRKSYDEKVTTSILTWIKTSKET